MGGFPTSYEFYEPPPDLPVETWLLDLYLDMGGAPRHDAATLTVVLVGESLGITSIRHAKRVEPDDPGMRHQLQQEVKLLLELTPQIRGNHAPHDHTIDQHTPAVPAADVVRLRGRGHLMRVAKLVCLIRWYEVSPSSPTTRTVIIQAA